MAFLELSHIRKAFGEAAAVEDFSLSAERGEFVSFLGPSGCGKTTTLRMIAGFERPTSGSLRINDVDMTFRPPNQRNVGMVFQSYALFPNMTIAQNVGYGLKVRKMPTSDVKRRVGELLEMIKLPDKGDRYPYQLSGGQQQRVALARALVLQPAVLLLDEPLGALDAKLRRSLKVELKALQEEVGITFLYVTHDQEEALTMSDRLAVMREGKIVQIGSPHDVYEQPADTYVADFLGTSNLMEVDVVGRGPGSACTVRLGESVLEVEHGGTEAPDHAHAVIRPERVQVEEYGSAGPNRVPAMVERLVYLGSATQVILRLAAGPELQALLRNDGSQEHLAHGTPVHLFLAPDAVRVLAGGGQVADQSALEDEALQAG
jgi:spermidine/putrescine ABC transporter ATP-binding subunit